MGNTAGSMGKKPTNTNIPDVQSAPPASPGIPDATLSYNTLMEVLKSGAAANAYVYLNKRVESRLFGDGKAKKIVTGATFVPAHSSCYEMGGFKVESMKYFVVHRPDYSEKGSTLFALLREFSTPGKTAASHFLIDLNGNLYQMVDLGDVAYHCGASSPANNQNSSGVELEGAVGSNITQAQYVTLAKLLGKLNSVSSSFLPDKNDADFVNKFKEKVVGHQDIRQDKGDPGRNFSYDLLAKLYRDNLTGYTTIYRPPISSVDEVQTLAAKVAAEAGQVKNAAGASAANSMVQQALASSRVCQMIAQGRTDLMVAGADTSQSQAAALAMLIASKTDAVAQSDITPVPINLTAHISFFDYTTNKFQGEG